MPWKIDPFHTLVEFAVWHLMINLVKGRFKEVHGMLELDLQHPENSQVKAEVEAASIDTGVVVRDGHLRSADFFEVAKYPTISFTSTSIKQTGERRGIVTGELSLHGVTHTVSFQTELTGYTQDPETKNWRIGLLAVTILDRREFNLNYGQAVTGGMAFVGNEVRIELRIEAVQM